MERGGGKKCDLKNEKRRDNLMLKLVTELTLEFCFKIFIGNNKAFFKGLYFN